LATFFATMIKRWPSDKANHSCDNNLLTVDIPVKIRRVTGFILSVTQLRLCLEQLTLLVLVAAIVESK